MPELQIPDELKADCANCQGLCCMAMEHKPGPNFPILNPKPVGVSCGNLETNPDGPDGERQLYRCKIHEALEADGWGTCNKFDCYGAGQAISKFFKELGVSWAAKKPEGMTARDRRTHEYNLRCGYLALYNAFIVLNMVKSGQNAQVYEAAKEALRPKLKEFELELARTNGYLDERYWGLTFRYAINEAILP